MSPCMLRSYQVRKRTTVINFFITQMRITSCCRVPQTIQYIYCTILSMKTSCYGRDSPCHTAPATLDFLLTMMPVLSLCCHLSWMFSCLYRNWLLLNRTDRELEFLLFPYSVMLLRQWGNLSHLQRWVLTFLLKFSITEMEMSYISQGQSFLDRVPRIQALKFQWKNICCDSPKTRLAHVVALINSVFLRLLLKAFPRLITIFFL